MVLMGSSGVDRTSRAITPAWVGPAPASFLFEECSTRVAAVDRRRRVGQEFKSGINGVQTFGLHSAWTGFSGGSGSLGSGVCDCAVIQNSGTGRTCWRMGFQLRLKPATRQCVQPIRRGVTLGVGELLPWSRWLVGDRAVCWQPFALQLGEDEDGVEQNQDEQYWCQEDEAVARRI